MAKFVWTSQLNIGIEVIDQQHLRIVEYINQLDDIQSRPHSQKEIKSLVDALVDYTVSHFGFEESLQEEAGYPFIKAHKRVHELFIRRVSDFQKRLENNEDISEELNSLLVVWLASHIRGDDFDYAECVRTYLQNQHGFVETKKGLFARLFG
jgi:hemerythrin